VEKLQLAYLRPETARQYDFYLIPKLLIDHEAFDDIDYGAKLLYSLMLNRASLSAQNAEDFTDQSGHLYIIYTIEQVMGDLRCCNKTAIKMLKQLEDIGLIEKKRQGQGKPSITYVKDFASVHFLKCNIYTSRSVHCTSQDVYNVHCNKNDISYTDYSKNNSINQPIPEKTQSAQNEEKSIDMIDDYTHGDYMEIIYNNIKYPSLATEPTLFDDEWLNEIVQIMSEAVSSTKKTLRVNGENMPQNTVKNRLLELNREHIAYVAQCLSENTTSIKNIKSYLLSALFNAPITIKNYQRATTQHITSSAGKKKKRDPSLWVGFLANNRIEVSNSFK
jgi:hypothetical protein